MACICRKSYDDYLGSYNSRPSPFRIPDQSKLPLFVVLKQALHCWFTFDEILELINGPEVTIAGPYQFRRQLLSLANQSNFSFFMLLNHYLHFFFLDETLQFFNNAEIVIVHQRSFEPSGCKFTSGMGGVTWH